MSKHIKLVLIISDFVLFCILMVLTGCTHDLSSDGYWGKPSNMLRIHVDVARQTDGQHQVSVTFQNFGQRQIKIWESGFWPNTLLQCYDDSGRSAETTVEGGNLLKAFTPGGSRIKNYLVTLSPGQTHYSGPVLLERVYKLEPHRNYRVRVTYEERWAGGWIGTVTSNVVIVKAE